MKKKRYWRIALYILGFFPSIFIIFLLAFYIHAGIILDYWNISGINPAEFYLYYFYQYIIIYSWIISVFTLAIWIIVLFVYVIKNRKKVEWKSVTILSVIYLIAILLAFSKIFEFALD